MTRFFVALLVTGVLSWNTMPANAQAFADGDDVGSTDALASPVQWMTRRVAGSFKPLGDWGEQHRLMMNAVDRVFERNGWNSESDQFARGLARDVEAIPPWEFDRRLDRLTGILGQRYQLDDAQRELLRQRVVQESMQLFLAHGGEMLQNVMEVVQTRNAGEAITADQVAEWAERIGPAFEDMQQRVHALAGDLMSTMSPEQREIAQRDLDAADRRLARVSELREQWMQGEWDAADWGIDTDPIQQAGMRKLAEALAVQNDATAAAATEDDPKTKNGAADDPNSDDPANAGRAAADNDPWAVYVRGFIARYNLDPKQQAQAWITYRDRTGARYASRAAELSQHDDSQKTAAEVKSLAERHKEAVDRLFEQLKARLERIPTKGQRRDASDK